MKYTEASKPGMGDPYWYEWSVGLRYVIEMLVPDSGIESVEFQPDLSLGLDDVAVNYSSGSLLCIQVKHTRVGDTFTFGDLVSTASGGVSLLGELAQSWKKEIENHKIIQVLIATNRIAGNRTSSTQGPAPVVRPPLDWFFPRLAERVKNASRFCDILFPEYPEAWEEWIAQLSCIDNDADKLSFLKCFRIDTGMEGLQEIGASLVKRIQEVFQTDEHVAILLLDRFYSALKEWTTSDRNKPTVTADDVYEKLALCQSIQHYNQDLVPAEPFFPSRVALVDSLEREIRTGESRVVFVSGIPGTGKTNIISKLCSKRDSIIDIRYYAYEPIDPAREYLPSDVSRRVDKDYFWNELFNQLRNKLRGRLFKYSVPVINELMTLEEKRILFFKIASAYASDRGKPFIIAIDGIDHAARAAEVENTFLATIPSPEYLPENIKIILAGQPKENYASYPDWLFGHDHNIKEISVPSLQQEDIRSLVDSAFPHKEEDYRIQLSGLVNKYAEGNTLAAIFAVHEAASTVDLVDLERLLTDRKLSGNIREYYKIIWNDAIKRIGKPFVDYKIAGVLSLFNEPVTASKLSAIYSSELISESDWNNVLISLRPLLREDSGSYTILHNDVRVFLSGVLGREESRVKEVYSNLLDYYLALETKNIAYYTDVLRFMNAAGRLEEFEKVLTPSFVINAYINGLGLDELLESCVEILNEVKAHTPINWAQMRSLAFSCMTMDQIEKCQYEFEDASVLRRRCYIPINKFECSISPLVDWNQDLIYDVLSLIQKLINNCLVDRALQTFCKWFSGITISELLNCICDPNDDHSPSLRSTAEMLGRFVGIFGEYGLLAGCKALAKEHHSFVYELTSTAFDSIIRNSSGYDLQVAISNLEVFYTDHIISGIKYLLEADRVSDIQCVADVLKNHLCGHPLGIMLYYFMRIISSSVVPSAEEKEAVLKAIESIEFDKAADHNEDDIFSIYALVLAFMSSSSPDVSAHNVLEKYGKLYTYKKSNVIGVYYNNVCLIGKWLYELYRGVDSSVTPKELEQLMNALFIRDWTVSTERIDIYKLRPYLLKAYIHLSKSSSSEITTIIDRICDQAFYSNPVGPIMNVGFYYYRNDPGRIKIWHDDWFKSNGKINNLDIGERVRIIQDFVSAVHQYSLEHVIDCDALAEQIRWSSIGFCSNKDYSCNYLLDWYNGLVEKSNKVDDALATEVKTISDMIEVVGDNRLGYNVSCRTFEDIFSCGIESIKKALQNKRFLYQCFIYPEFFVYGLIGFLKTATVNQDSLLKAWSIGIAVLDWRDEEHHAAISFLQHEIEKRAEAAGFSAIHMILAEYGPAYVDLAPNPARNTIPEYPADIKEACMDLAAARETINKFLENEKTEYKDLKNATSLLSGNGCEDYKLLTELLHHELKKEKWGIGRNEVISCLFKKLPPLITDSIAGEYLSSMIGEDSSLLESVLPSIVLWKIWGEDESYAQEGMTQLFSMFRGWLTADNHYCMPCQEDCYDYGQHIDWDEAADIDALFYQIIRTLMLTHDADAVQTALSGMFLLCKTDPMFVSFIEKDWQMFHYRAKEWLLMIYELLGELCPDYAGLLNSCLQIHCTDEDFNVALYSNILLENSEQNGDFDYIKAEQPYFSKVPIIGGTKIIKALKAGSSINGREYTLSALKYLAQITEDDYSDIERRTSAYSDMVDQELSLLPLKRFRRGGYSITLDRFTVAFLRVLYIDWVKGRWDGIEPELARAILSASEPFILFVSPHPWKNNNGMLIDNINEFIKQPAPIRNATISELLSSGIDSAEMVIGGCVIDYNHNSEVMCCHLAYLITPYLALATNGDWACEQTSRLFLQKREDFAEDIHSNITLRYNGVISFSNSMIEFGPSKLALVELGWQVSVSSHGFIITNTDGAIIGRMEYYYGQRNSGNYTTCNQPILQRWIVNKEEIESLPIQMATDSFIVPRE